MKRDENAARSGLQKRERAWRSSRSYAENEQLRQRPSTAAEVPRKNIAKLKIQPSSVSFQSPGAD